MYRLNLDYSHFSPREAAIQALQDLSVQFGGESVTGELAVTDVKTSLAGTHVHLQQAVDGIPVYGARFNVSFDKSGNVRMITGNPMAGISVPVMAPVVSALSAVDLALEYMAVVGSPMADPVTQPVLFRDSAGNDHLAVLVLFVSMNPMGDWEVLVDAATGDVLHVVDRMCYVDGSGMAFEPDPLTSASVRYGGEYVDSGDSDLPALNDERFEIELLDIFDDDGTYRLQGPWVTLLDFEEPYVDPVTADSPDGFSFLRSESGFEDVMVYYHISRSQVHMQLLGFDDIQHGPIEADPHGLGGDDNSHFIPSLNRLAFGEGGVDDAEDSDVIIHEYGHAIQHDQVPEWTGGHTASLGEGFGDYWAGSYSIRYSDYYSHWTFNWDGHNPFWAGRRLDFPGTYPNNWGNDIYHNGQIWASTLWEIRAEAGGDVTDAIVLQAHYYLSTGATAEDNAEALVLSDELLFGGANQDIILEKLYTRGFLTPPPEYGSIAGTISESGTGAPLYGATIILSNEEYEYSTTSQNNGAYSLQDVITGDYEVLVTLENYVPWTGSATILSDQEITLDVTIGQPTLHAIPNDLDLEVFISEALDTVITLTNSGTGTASWGVRLRDLDEPVIEPWSSMSSFEIDESFPFGVEIVNGNYIISGANGTDNPNKFYILNPLGSLLAVYDQPSETDFGYRDLCWDGTLLWGSEGEHLVGMTTTGTIQDSIFGPHSLNRAIGYDPGSDLFWCGNQYADLIAVNRDGEEVARYEHTLNVQGLSWYPYDPEGMTLYITSITNDGQGARTAIAKMSTATGEYRLLTQLDESNDGNLVLGHTISNTLNGHENSWHHSTIIYNPFTENILVSHDLANSLPYLTISPAFGQVSPSGEIPVNLHYDALLLQPGLYEGYIEFLETNTGAVEPVNFDLTVVNVNVEPELSANKFSITPAYPNPFNPQTTFKCTLSGPETITLKVFDILGREVDRMKYNADQSGEHLIHWGAPSDLASGIYFAQISFANVKSLQKLVLLK